MEKEKKENQPANKLLVRCPNYYACDNPLPPSHPPYYGCGSTGGECGRYADSPVATWWKRKYGLGGVDVHGCFIEIEAEGFINLPTETIEHELKSRQLCENCACSPHCAECKFFSKFVPKHGGKVI